MVRISLFFSVFLIVINTYSQEKESYVGVNLTPGISFFYMTNYDEPIFSGEYEPVFSPGFDFNYSKKTNSFTFGLSVGLEVIRDDYVNKVDTLSMMDTNMNITYVYVGLETSDLLSQYRVHISPMFRWNFLQKEKMDLFIEIQPGIIHNMLMQKRLKSDFQDVYQDSDTTLNDWYSKNAHFKFLSFSLSGKLGFQYAISDKLSLNVAAFYRNYLSSFVKEEYATDFSFIYYKYGLETGLKFKLN